MSSEWANIAVAAAVLLCGLSLMLCVLGLTAYGRMRNAKLLFVSLAFLGFALQGAYLAWLAYQKRADVAAGSAGEFPILTVANLAIVTVLYMAVLKR